LRTQGFSLCADFLPAAAIAELRAEMTAAAAGFRAAGVGRDRDFVQDADVRTDQIQWLDPRSSGQADFLRRMDDLRVCMNRQLLLCLFDYEAHFAQYAAGALYRRHRDTFIGAGTDDRKPRRVVSSVCYLNSDWGAGDGGELVLYDAGDQELLRVLPTAGAAVFFLSEEFPHEVLPATRARSSIAGWFRSRGG
jgi:SM-20-related protein